MSEQIIIAATGFAGLGLVALAALRGWQGWLALKEHELERLSIHYANRPANQPHEIEQGPAIGAARIEIADLKERIRKLEAIANGVDL